MKELFKVNDCKITTKEDLYICKLMNKTTDNYYYLGEGKSLEEDLSSARFFETKRALKAKITNLKKCKKIGKYPKYQSSEDFVFFIVPTIKICSSTIFDGSSEEY